MDEHQRSRIITLVRNITDKFIKDLCYKTSYRDSSELANQMIQVLECISSHFSEETRVCTYCKGTGAYTTINSPQYGKTEIVSHVCNKCNGFGKIR